MRHPEKTSNMELKKYLQVVVKWWWLIAICVIVAGAASYLGSRSTPRMYSSRTTLMVGQAQQNPNPTQSDFYTAQALAQSYIDLVRREPVLQATLDTLGLDWDWVTLQNMVTSRIVPGTQLIEVAVLDTHPNRAQTLAAEIAHQLIQQSPAGTDPEGEAQRDFILTQIDDLKTNIQKSQSEIRQLDDVIAKANSARQIQDARGQQSALQAQVSTWQTTYNQMLTNLHRGTTNFLSVVEPAQLPSAPVGSSAISNVLLAAVIGAALAIGAAFVLSYLDDSLHSPDEVREVMDLPTLGTVARIPGTINQSKLIANQPRSPVAESYRVLRTNLQFSTVDRRLCSVMVSSAVPGEGKSLMSANLAVIMAQTGKRVILIDADLRRPNQHRIFGLSNNQGLSTALLGGDEQLKAALQRGPVDNLQILPAGPIPPNPTELLGSRRMHELMASLCTQADFVILDSPPVTAVADASVLAAHADGTLLVVDAGRTRRGQAQRCRDALQAVGANVLGVIINHYATQKEYYYYAEDGAHQRRPMVVKITTPLIRLAQRSKRPLSRKRVPSQAVEAKGKPERS
jgi:succinoglycan biosynthesis transport protein ExoP